MDSARNKTYTPDGCEVFNPLSWGVHGKGLMVAASSHNREIAMRDMEIERLTLIVDDIKRHCVGEGGPLGFIYSRIQMLEEQSDD